MATCPHEVTHLVGDVPIADPESFAFVGRFDIKFCSECNAEISRTPKATT